MLRSIRWYILGLTIITGLALLLRFFELDSTPPGYTWDEMSITYNAWSIKEWHRDENAIFMPLSFRSFGDYKPPVFIYLMSGIFLITPLDPFYTRLVASLFGFGTAILGGVLAHSLARFITSESDYRIRVGIIVYAFVAISPWSVHLSRIGFEQNMTVFLITLGVLLITVENATFKNLVGGFLTLILSLYTFHTAKIVVPLLIGWWLLYFAPRLQRRLKKRVIVLLALLVFGILPIIYEMLTVSGLARASALIIFNANSGLNSAVEGISQLVGNMYGQLSPQFWLQGWDKAAQRNAVTGIAPMYPLTYLLLIVAIIWSIISKTRLRQMWRWWFLVIIGMAPALLSWNTPNYLRSLWSIIPLSFIFSLFIIEIITHPSIHRIRFSLIIGLLALYGYSIINFTHYYFGPEYEARAAAEFQYGYEQLFQTLKKYDGNGKQIIISEFYGQPYIYALVYNRIHPQNYQFGALNRYRFIGLEYGQRLENNAVYAAASHEIDPTDPRVVEVIKAPKSDTILWVIAQT